MEYDIQIEGVEKSYGETEAVRNVTLSVEKGELFGLIGPDGAGKTTLIRIMVGLIKADSGSVLVGGLDVARNLFRIKEIIGYLSQRFSLYPDLTVQENIRFYGQLFQVSKEELKEREKKLLAFSRLEPFRNRRAGALSGGMKQKLALCCSLIHTPRILFLDEPTTGVDPVSRREFWDILSELQQAGTTVFVSTAYMEEATRCDRVGLMFEGQLMALDSPKKLPESYPYSMLEVRVAEPVAKVSLLVELPIVRSVQVFGDRLHVGVDKVEEAGKMIEELISGKVGEAVGFREIEPGLEDVFVELISRPQA
ncbi:MAG TPA: ABC transporter ATP-binding protein [archaeon]|nr:ABC transporter ATP-binding protein [archaeon]